MDVRMRPGKHCLLRYFDPIEEKYVERRVVARSVKMKGGTHVQNFYTEIVGRWIRPNTTVAKKQVWQGNQTSMLNEFDELYPESLPE